MIRREYAPGVAAVQVSGIRKWFEGAGPGSINLGLGQPDLPTPARIGEAAIAAIRDNKTGYTPNAGIPELREALAEKFLRENQVRYTPDQIIVTAGASEALHLVMQSLVRPGDRVLVQDPGFVSYAALATIAGGRPEGLKLDGKFHIDLEQAKAALDGARLMVINSPANPTGAVEPEQSVRALVEYAMDAGVTVVSDEVYEHFTYGVPHTSPARFGDDVITINATSKTYAMTGWRIGCMAGPEEHIAQCIKVHQYAQACATSIAQYAAVEAYIGDQACVGMMRDEYRSRLDLVYAGLTDLGFAFPRPEGAFYLFVPMDPALAGRIIDHGVTIVPGEAFGVNEPDFARISYAASRDNLTTALGRIRAVMSDKSW